MKAMSNLLVTMPVFKGNRIFIPFPMVHGPYGKIVIFSNDTGSLETTDQQNVSLRG